MATTKKRSSGSATIPKTAIEKVHSTLQDLPEKPKENLSLREAIGELHESITTALNRGYSYEEVVRILSDKNVDITVASLKRYLAAARKEVADSKPRRGRRGAGKRSTTGRSRRARLEQQSEELSNAATAEDTEASVEAPDEAAEGPETQPTRGRKRQTKTTSTRAGRGRASSTAKTAAKTKSTPRKTTSRSTSTRGRRKQSDTSE